MTSVPSAAASQKLEDAVKAYLTLAGHRDPERQPGSGADGGRVVFVGLDLGGGSFVGLSPRSHPLGRNRFGDRVMWLLQ